MARQKCRSEVSIKSVVQRCRSKVSLRSIGRKFRQKDCGARMISTNFDMLQARQDEPIARQGQRKWRQRKNYHAPAKQHTSKRPPLDRKSHWHGNENTQPSKTDSRTGPTKTAHHKSSKLTRSALLHWESHSAIIRTVADGCERLRTVAQHPANKASPPDPQDETRTLCYAFGKHCPP